jgi:Fe2+ or Zn2+ uptake regulation protein
MPTKKIDIFKEATNTLYAYLNKHHMRHTAERIFILEAICRLKSFTVDELREQLTEMNISRATVYNTLTILEKAEIIHRVEKEFGIRATQYELILHNESSVQIICTRCGRVSKVKDTTIQRMLSDKRWTNFCPQHFALYIYGKCKICRNKKTKNN